ASFTVSNSAPAIVSNGADTLHYSFTSSGHLSGSGSGSEAALGGVDTQSATFDTSTAGVQSGAVQVTSSSVSVANGSFSHQFDLTVLNHSIPSFSTTSLVQSYDLDFGTLPQGGTVSDMVNLANLISA